MCLQRCALVYQGLKAWLLVKFFKLFLEKFLVEHDFYTWIRVDGASEGLNGGGDGAVTLTVKNEQF